MDKTALLIIDVQEAFNDRTWGERNNRNAEKNISKILDIWRKNGLQVIHIQHKSDDVNSLFHPNHKGFGIKGIVKPINDEPIFTKKVNSSFIGTNLDTFLKENGITTLVITGLTTPHCVSTTARMSSNLGFNTILVSDASAAFGIQDHNGKYYDAETIHSISLATMHQEFATIVTTEELINHIKSRVDTSY